MDNIITEHAEKMAHDRLKWNREILSKNMLKAVKNGIYYKDKILYKNIIYVIKDGKLLTIYRRGKTLSWKDQIEK
jgi:predicted amidohydrolase